jgi:hypothetical protein
MIFKKIKEMIERWKKQKEEARFEEIKEKGKTPFPRDNKEVKHV